MTEFKKLNLIMGNWDAMSPKKKIKGPCSKLKRIQISNTQKSEFKKKEELKSANKTSHGVRRFIHDTPTDILIHPLTGMIHPLTGRMHFFDFLIKVDLINFNLMAKGVIKKNLVIEEIKSPETLQ
jgi:hypothetical protein